MYHAERGKRDRDVSGDAMYFPPIPPPVPAPRHQGLHPVATLSKRRVKKGPQLFHPPMRDIVALVMAFLPHQTLPILMRTSKGFRTAIGRCVFLELPTHGPVLTPTSTKLSRETRNKICSGFKEAIPVALSSVETLDLHRGVYHASTHNNRLQIANVNLQVPSLVVTPNVHEFTLYRCNVHQLVVHPSKYIKHIQLVDLPRVARFPADFLSGFTGLESCYIATLPILMEIGEGLLSFCPVLERVELRDLPCLRTWSPRHLIGSMHLRRLHMYNVKLPWDTPRGEFLNSPFLQTVHMTAFGYPSVLNVEPLDWGVWKRESLHTEPADHANVVKTRFFDCVGDQLKGLSLEFVIISGTLLFYTYRDPSREARHGNVQMHVFGFNTPLGLANHVRNMVKTILHNRDWIQPGAETVIVWTRDAVTLLSSAFATIEISLAFHHCPAYVPQYLMSPEIGVMLEHGRGGAYRILVTDAVKCNLMEQITCRHIKLAKSPLAAYQISLFLTEEGTDDVCHEERDDGLTVCSQMESISYYPIGQITVKGATLSWIARCTGAVRVDRVVGASSDHVEVPDLCPTAYNAAWDPLLFPFVPHIGTDRK